MTAYTIGILFFVAWLLIAIPALILLLRTYSRTRMTSMLWLLVAVVVWPAIARLFSIYLPMYAAATGMPTHGIFGNPYLNVFVLISLAETIIGGLLLVVALYLLDRDLTTRRQPPPPPAAYPAL